MPLSTDERIIRLVVKTTKISDDTRLELNVSNEICVVDASVDFDTVKRQISVQVGFDVESLSLFTFQDGHIIAISKIKSPIVLRDHDIVLAFRKGHERLMGSDEAKNSAARAYPSPGSRIDHQQNSSTTDGPHELQASSARTAAMDRSLTMHEDASQFGAIGNIVRKTFGWFGQLFRGGASIDANMDSNQASSRTHENSILATDSERMSQDYNAYGPKCPLQLLASVAEAPNENYLASSYHYEPQERYYQEAYERGQYGAEHERTEVDKQVGRRSKRIKDDKYESRQTSNTSENSDDDSNDDAVGGSYRGHARPIHSRYHKLGIHPKNRMNPLLTEEQRLELEGMEFNLDDFVKFLVKEAGKSANNVHHLANKIDQLVKGEAISYKYWTGGDSDFYAEPPIEDMSANVYMIRNDAFHHEDIHGKDRSNGWLLKIPLRKFQNFQLYCYDNRKKIFSSQAFKSQSGRKSEQLKQPNHDSAIVKSSRPKYGINTRVRKNFGPYGYWEGKVFSVDSSTGRYGVRFTDGDERFFTESEIDKFADLYKKRNRSQQSQSSDSESSSSSSEEEDDSDESEEEESDESPTKKQKIVTRWKDPLMTDKKREKLKGIPIDMDGFRKFLQKDGICPETIGRVITKVSMLLSGQGISYKGWPDDVVFRPRINDLSADFYKLQEDSVEYEEKYGRDSSKGWLVRHPLQKLEKYQAYFYKTKLAKYKNQPIRPIRHRLLLSP